MPSLNRSSFRQYICILLFLKAYSYGNAQKFITKDGFHYGFGECVGNQRTMYYYSPTELTCSNNQSTKIIAKPPVHGMKCDIECGKGYYLGVNTSGPEPQSMCQRCPKGTYSLGGGILLSKMTGAWKSPLPPMIQTKCLTHGIFDSSWTENCNPWITEENFSVISSGDNKGFSKKSLASRLVNMLRMSVSLVRDGSVTFQYKVDAEDPYDGLSFTVDMSTKMDTVSQTNGWKEFRTNLSIGPHTLIWEYTKDYSTDGGLDKAWIKVIEVEGTSYSDSSCHPCSATMTTQDTGTLCTFCNANHYAGTANNSLEYECLSCPNGFFSPPGSIGEESCSPRYPCSKADYTLLFSNCVDGLRNGTYVLIQPQMCNDTMENSIPPPLPVYNLSCFECEKGLYLNEEGICQSCPPGHVLGLKVPKKQRAKITGAFTSPLCYSCPQQTYSVTQLFIGDGSVSGWSVWPKWFDKTGALANDWRLSENSLRHVFRPEQNEVSRRYVLSLNISFATSGEFSIKYSLKNLPSNNSVNPRSPQAWFSFEMDSTPMELAHGKENGTFVEKFAVPIPGIHKLTWIWRVSYLPASIPSEVEILQLNASGTEEGGSTYCTYCPKGFIPSLDQGHCEQCPSGTFSNYSTGNGECSLCPPNTFSPLGSNECRPCGNHTNSVAGSKTCSAPEILTLTTSLQLNEIVSENEVVKKDEIRGNNTTETLSTTNSSQAGNDLLQTRSDWKLQYNLSRIQAAAVSWNDSTISAVQDTRQNDPINITSFISDKYGTLYYFGLFRQGVPHLASPVGLQDSQLPSDSYVMTLIPKNPQNAGNKFYYNANLYGTVECTVPTHYRLVNHGRFLEINPIPNGGGLSLHYTGGDQCKGDELYSTTFNILCDLSSVGRNEDIGVPRFVEGECAKTFEWRTSFACPICEKEYFSQTRSECISGRQTVQWQSALVCSGGSTRDAEAHTQECTQIVLDKRTMYSAYIVVIAVVAILIGMMVFAIVTHRKYRNTYEEFIYLKGKMNKSQVTKTGDETVFEFDESGVLSPGRGRESRESPRHTFPTVNSSVDNNDEIADEFHLGSPNIQNHP